MSNMVRINKSAFTHLTTGTSVEAVSVATKDGKQVFTFEDVDGKIIGEMTVKGEQERYYCQEDLVKSLPAEKQQKHAHNGRKQRQRKEV